MPTGGFCEHVLALACHGEDNRTKHVVDEHALNSVTGFREIASRVRDNTAHGGVSRWYSSDIPSPHNPLVHLNRQTPKPQPYVLQPKTPNCNHPKKHLLKTEVMTLHIDPLNCLAQDPKSLHPTPSVTTSEQGASVTITQATCLHLGCRV